ncbi:odorant receptor 13a-like [Athalia rosae]|uniref:odorant receptor 13a-like n=1 Tax=Athalia rosae TaxID=37344 RepID=UPI002034944B|nr:odorant receptor 13a-like [Athalia rosae]
MVNTFQDHHGLLRSWTNALKVMGMWRIDQNSSPVRRYLYMSYKCFILSLIFLFILALAADIFYCSDNLLIITDDGCILAGLSVIFFKIMNFQLYLDDLEKLLDTVHRDTKKLHEEKNAKHLKIWKQYFMIEKFFVYSFGTLGCFLVITLLFFTPTEIGALPIRSRYPFEVTDPPAHQIMFIYQGTVISISMAAIVIIDNTMLTLCNHAFCHFRILRDEFRNCRSKSAADREKSIGEKGGKKLFKRRETYDETEVKVDDNPKPFRTNFFKCIRHHQEVIEFVENIDNFSSPLMFVQLMSSNVMICLTGFQAILVVGQNSGFMKFAVYLSAAFLQLLSWCWFGSELIHQSTSVADAIWSTSWELEKITPMKSLITIPLLRAKKPLKLTAGNFYVMSMETFISVLSGSYSFFALLNTMNESAK